MNYELKCYEVMDSRWHGLGFRDRYKAIDKMSQALGNNDLIINVSQ